jgi:prephenate dehydratase
MPAKAKSVAYLGEPGSYSYQTARILFPDLEFSGHRNFTEVIQSVETRERDVAVIPVENSISGRIPDVHRLMLSMELFISGEYMLRIEHCLIRNRLRPQLAEGPRPIRRIFSHSQGFIQCKDYIEAKLPDAELIETSDTAAAVRLVAQSSEPDIAAIGPEIAAEVHGAVVVEREIATQKNNYTRFLILVRHEDAQPDPDADVTTLIFQVDHQPGALLRALAVFNEENINITKLETYTISEQTALPTFYIDIGAGLETAPMQAALKKLERNARYIKMLGTYRSSALRNAMSGYLPVTAS